jgi:hypothetical protein
MKKFSVPCNFNGSPAPFSVYIGEPEKSHHPLHFQAEWLTSHRGGTISPKVMESVASLHEIAKKNNVSLEELCVYALSEFGDKLEGNAEEAAPPPPPKPK